jgi:hypothetical protein
VLSSVLPGLRDVRAPLAAGYLWLLSFYLGFEPVVLRHPTGIWKTLSHLGHTFSAVGVGLAVTFIAYLVGSISQSVFGFPSDSPSLVGDHEVNLSVPPSSLPEHRPKPDSALKTRLKLAQARFTKWRDVDLADNRADRVRNGLRRLDRIGKRLSSLTKNDYSPIGERALEETAERVQAFTDAIQRRAASAEADAAPIRFLLAALDYTAPLSDFLTEGAITECCGRR